MSGPATDPAPPLPSAERARGRRIAIASHPAGMTFFTAFTGDLATQALLTLGASEAAVGLHRGLVGIGQMLQLPTLRAVARFEKRWILIAGQSLALLGAVPLVLFMGLRALGSEIAVPIALASFGLATAGIVVGQTVWFPLLRGYMEPARVGRFFGTLRSGWHIALILFFVGCHRWLDGHAGSFGLLFGIAWACGLLRIAFVARLPERSEVTGQRIRVREAVGLLRSEPALRRFLLGMSLDGAVLRSVIPFGIVMMRRELGLGEAETLLCTIAFFAGGLVSLYPWGFAVDRAGPIPIFGWTSLARSALLLALIAVPAAGPAALGSMVGFFFLFSVLGAGFGVADTELLFRLAPAEAPARLIVVSTVVRSLVTGVAPIAAGLLIELLIAEGLPPTRVYQGFFALAAVVQLAAPLPLRHLGRL